MNDQALRESSASSSAAALLLRVVLAGVLFPHGAQKLLGWFGGHGFSGTKTFLTENVGLPAPLAVFIILLEFFGPILLLLGLATRFVALACAGLMVGAIATVHWEHGFFMNWSGTQEGEGFEYHLLLLGIAFALVLMGGEAWSLDAKLSGRRKGIQ